jgi:hypothetical protein
MGQITVLFYGLRMTAYGYVWTQSPHRLDGRFQVATSTDRSTPSARCSPEAAADELAQPLGIQESEQRAYLSMQLGELASHSDAFQSINAAGLPSKQA